MIFFGITDLESSEPVLPNLTKRHEAVFTCLAVTNVIASFGLIQSKQHFQALLPRSICRHTRRLCVALRDSKPSTGNRSVSPLIKNSVVRRIETREDLRNQTRDQNAHWVVRTR